MTYRELKLPKEVYDKIKERYVDVGHVFDIDFDSFRNRSQGGFDWSSTIEYQKDNNFWHYILSDSFSNRERGLKLFYKLYPKTCIEVTSDPRVYKATIKGKLYEVIIKEVKDEN